MPEAPGLSDDAVERALRGAAAFVDYPDVPDLSGVVGRRLRDEAAPTRVQRGWRGLRLRRVLRPVLRPAVQPALARAAVAFAVIVAVFAGTMVFSPSARHAVAGWPGLRGVKITVTQ